MCRHGQIKTECALCSMNAALSSATESVSKFEREDATVPLTHTKRMTRCQECVRYRLVLETVLMLLADPDRDEDKIVQAIQETLDPPGRWSCHAREYLDKTETK